MRQREPIPNFLHSHSLSLSHPLSLPLSHSFSAPLVVCVVWLCTHKLGTKKVTKNGGKGPEGVWHRENLRTHRAEI